MKILIIGSVASGKTTLGKQLSKLLNIAHYELDNVAHDDLIKGSPIRSYHEQEKIINNFDQTGAWIAEGIYRESHKQIYEFANVILFLDINLLVRKVRIFIRFVKQQMRIESCHYKPDLKMLKFMYKLLQEFEVNKHNFEELLNPHKHKILRIHKAPSDLSRLIKSVKKLPECKENI